MVTDNKGLNIQQTKLRQLLTDAEEHNGAIELFLVHHGQLHSAKMSSDKLWSYEDDLLDDVNTTQAKHIPDGLDHSIVWVLWHLARIEDIAMSILVGGIEQVFIRDGWMNRLKIHLMHSGNEMAASEVAKLTQDIDYSALRAYRAAVGCQTREIVSQLSHQDLTKKVPADRLQRVLAEGAVVPQAQLIIDYWSRRTIAGLLLMPATRHNLVHLNEIAKLKKRVV